LLDWIASFSVVGRIEIVTFQKQRPSSETILATYYNVHMVRKTQVNYYIRSRANTLYVKFCTVRGNRQNLIRALRQSSTVHKYSGVVKSGPSFNRSSLLAGGVSGIDLQVSCSLRVQK
jgi:hypothetical protein